MDNSMQVHGELTPDKYFEDVKGNLEVLSADLTTKEYKVMQNLLHKYMLTNQIVGAKKLQFYMSVLKQERELIRKGVTSYVPMDVIKEYITEIEGSAVKLIDLKDYPRELPDTVVTKYLSVEDIFDNYYVLFTDYTDEVSRQVSAQRRDKDPILFGTFSPKEPIPGVYSSDKMYFIADWEDEYCDLTLSKMVNEMALRGVTTEYPIVDDTRDIEAELSTWVYKYGEYVKEDVFGEQGMAIEGRQEEKKNTLLSRIKGLFKRKGDKDV